jgi:outer membrane protein OmpA-like peptidoglycan-associated protein
LLIAVNRKGLLVFLLLLYHLILSSQPLTKKQFIKAVLDADSYFYYEQDYEKAASYYQPLVDTYPDNSNLAAKLGICNLNIDGKKSDALKYLKFAVRNVVKNDEEYTEYGELAPLDSYLYIAIAYQQNDSLEKAIKLFTEAKKRLSGFDIFSSEYINNQIKNCNYAIEAEKNPYNTEINLLMPWLNEFPGACNPVLSGNDSVFVFTRKQNGKTRILCSYKSDSWKLPKDITDQLGGIERYYSNSITGDGKMLIIYLDDGQDGNLYYSHRKDSTWSKIKSMGRTINTIYWEAHGFITPDGKTLYFSSNKPGGKGELDIWTSQKDKDGSWKQPVNCGSVINTPYNENTPFFNPETGTLLFSSTGHTSIGGYDIFRSVYQKGSWSHPTGLPFPVNKTTDDAFFIFNNSETEYITSVYDEKTRYRNIYSIKTGEPSEKRITAEGVLTMQDGLAVDPEKASILLTDYNTGIPLKSIVVQDPSSYKLEVRSGDFKIRISPVGSKTDTIAFKTQAETIVKSQHLTDTGLYSFVVNPGNYLLYVRQPGYKTDTIVLNLPPGHSGNVIQIKSTLIPDKVYEQNFLMIRNILFEFDSYILDDKAIATLEMLRSILTEYPELKIEVAGYTDSKGSAEHNLKLAENRADEIIKYLSKEGISSTRLTRKVFGSSDFAALNTNADGTDNPEGRKYNRRATFGIVDPKTGIIIRQETYTPRHLRHPSSFKYSIVLLKSAEELKPNQFSSLEMAATLFINPVKIESSNAYVIGEFMNRMDATKYLQYAKEKGFKDAFIVTQYDLNIPVNESGDENHLQKVEPEGKKFTIQLAASRKPMNMSYFKGTEGVREVYSSDNYYRYICGEYVSVAKARSDVTSLRESGFKDAFIRNISSIPK